MTQTRREFITRASAVTFAGGALTQTGLAKAAMRAVKPRRILFLGGTGFIGPPIVNMLLEQGDEVTLFNRGNRSHELFPDVETLVGNRIVGEGPGLDPLQEAIDAGRTWDAVIDTASVHTWVENSAAMLKNAAKHYVFTSSLSAYADNSVINQTEADGEECEMPDEEADKIDRLPYNMEYYGAVKVRAERAAERHFPGRTTVLRPGLIVGPRDQTHRFTYWPLRIRQGGEVLAPGNPHDRVMVVDARDLARFLVRLINNKGYGVYNVNGPDTNDLTIGGLLDECKKATGSDSTFTWADGDWHAERDVHNWAQMPVWINPVPEMQGFHRKSMAKSLKAGFKTRPLGETIKDTLDWFDNEYMPILTERGGSYLPGERHPGISLARERELLAQWKSRDMSEG